jgi:hypothetical protein
MKEAIAFEEERKRNTLTHPSTIECIPLGLSQEVAILSCDKRFMDKW